MISRGPISRRISLLGNRRACIRGEGFDVGFYYTCFCMRVFIFIFISDITEVGSKKDQDHPSVAGLESKWCSQQRSMSSFSLQYQYIVKETG